MKNKTAQNKRKKGILFKERKGFGVISLIFLAVLIPFYAIHIQGLPFLVQ